MSHGAVGKRRRAVSDWVVEALEGRTLLSQASPAVGGASALEKTPAAPKLLATTTSLQAATAQAGPRTTVTLVAKVLTAPDRKVVRTGRVRFSVVGPTRENLGAARPDRIGQARLTTSKLRLGGTYQLLARYVSPQGRFAPSSTELRINVGQPEAAALRITAPRYFGAPGTPITFSVTAIDRAGQTVTDYTGTIDMFSPTDHSAKFTPRTYTFTTADHGTHEFAGGVTFHKGGAEVVKVDQITNTRIAGTQRFGIE